jgi:aspartyl protease family protein
MNNRYIIYSLSVIFATALTACSHTRRERGDRSVGSRSGVETGAKRDVEIPASRRETVSSARKSIVKMRKESGVYYVPCKINGTEMDFIFDTGASDITMSLTEALFLYKQGKLRDDDIVDTQQYQIADGSIHEGTVIVLRKVEIGDWVLSNVKASIVDNMGAPLLLGQSALAEFGKISIDYHRNEITFFE